MFALPFMRFFRAAKKAEEPHSPLKILVADDDADSVTTLTALLESEGYVVQGFSRGLDALRIELDYKPQVIILDLHMPDIGGYDVARWLNCRYRKQRPLLVAISGAYTRPADGELARVCGFDHYLTKPFDIGQLLSILRSAAMRAPGSTKASPTLSPAPQV